MKALRSEVIIRPIAREQKTENGIIIPDTSKGQPNKGLVISSGPKSKVSPGSIISFPEYGGITVDVNNEKVTILKDTDIILIHNS